MFDGRSNSTNADRNDAKSPSGTGLLAIPVWNCRAFFLKDAEDFPSPDLPHKVANGHPQTNT